MRFPENSQQLDNFLISPVPQINWRRSDGMPFPNKIKLRKFNGMLEIQNFQQEDTGSYECIAENSRGKNVARGRLTYYGKQQLWGKLSCGFHSILDVLRGSSRYIRKSGFNLSLSRFYSRFC
jgi:hypothetical protein